MRVGLLRWVALAVFGFVLLQGSSAISAPLGRSRFGSTAVENINDRPTPKPAATDASREEILKQDGYSFEFDAPAAGELSVVWTATVKHEPVTVGSGHATVIAVGRVKIRIALSAAGRSDLELYPELKITAAATFTTAGLVPVRSSSSFTL